MKTLKELYRVGKGPSSSHTMGPERASVMFLDRNRDAKSFEVTLYGSLAATGKGHMTDEAIKNVLSKTAPLTIVWKSSVFLPFHPNGMQFKSFDADGNVMEDWTVFSVGGGALSTGENNTVDTFEDIYDLTDIESILAWCRNRGKSFWEYVASREEKDLDDYLQYIWENMQVAVENGLDNEGSIPGPLHISRKAAVYYVKARGYKQNLQSRGLVYAYSLAVSEENACGGTIVTAPTCGSCGVLPAVLYHLSRGHQFSDQKIRHALATAGLFGNVVKNNASISGAEVGCQGEVGVACAMASAAATQLFGGSPTQIEYAAEMGLEHHLGMTCDPIGGLVQIPCIERNAFAAARALDSNIYASFSDGNHRISFDRVVDVMKQTGNDLPSLYKETSSGGLAKVFSNGLRR